ncbi:MAG: ATP phosphoribosyltransferase regulatory subunit [Pyrinomonadaceae bacterium]
MSDHLASIPNGMRYYFGEDSRLRRKVEDIAMSVFSGWSYEEITTPSIDYYSLFERGMGATEAQRAFRFMDTDGKLLALRPDVTSLVARAAATLYARRARPLRVCYVAPVFHQQAGSHVEWRRESTQLGCEHIGTDTTGVTSVTSIDTGDTDSLESSAMADTEILLIAIEVLQKLGLAGICRVTISSVEFFNGVAERLGLDAAARETMRRLMDVKDASELKSFLLRVCHAELESETFARLALLIGRRIGRREVISMARSIISNERSVAALNALEKQLQIFEVIGLGDWFEIDLSDVSELNYYTGLAFKIYVNGSGSYVGRGGRYDNLTANFGHAEPAVGFVLDLDALTTVITRRDQEEITGSKNSSPTRIGFKEYSPQPFIEALKYRERNEPILLSLDKG